MPNVQPSTVMYRCFLLILLASGASAQDSRRLVSVNPVPSGLFGSTLSDAGDVTGDGVTDLVVGAFGEWWYNTIPGRAYLIDGLTGYVIHGFLSPEGEPRGSFGAAVAGVGDVSGDGVPDVAVGAPAERAGAVHVFDGASGTVLFTLRPPVRGAFGHAVAGRGDVDGDGVPDIIVGAYKTDRESGRAYVFSGRTGGLIHTLSPSSASYGAHFGRAVAGGVDVTGDGVPDWAVAARGERVDGVSSGRVYVFNGATGSVAGTLASPAPTSGGQFGLSVALCESEGPGDPVIVVGAGREDKQHQEEGGAYVFDGASRRLHASFVSPGGERGGWFGQNVSCISDQNDDGTGDMAVSAVGESGGQGRVYLMSGDTGEALGELSRPSTVGMGRFGTWLAPVSIDGGTTIEIAIGANREAVDGIDQAGAAYLFPMAALGPVALVDQPSPPFRVGTPYPNPSRGAFAIDIDLPASEAVSYQILDGHGRLVRLHGPRGYTSGTHVIDVSPGRLPPGVYFVRVTVGETDVVRRVVLLP